MTVENGSNPRLSVTWRSAAEACPAVADCWLWWSGSSPPTPRPSSASRLRSCWCYACAGDKASDASEGGPSEASEEDVARAGKWG